MFLLIDSLQKLDFSQLCGVYAQSMYHADTTPILLDTKQRSAEESFYSFLLDFFTRYDGIYGVWVHNGVYCAAVRLEPYRDGFLLSGLETAPTFRRRGYAKQLLHSVLDYAATRGCARIYSHISRDNHASVNVHQSCGFRKSLNYAIFLDGSVSRTSDTFCVDL